MFGYGLGRLWVEALRSDAASLVAGVRVNIWMALAAILVGGTVAWRGRIRPRDDMTEVVDGA